MPDEIERVANSCRYERILDILNRLARGPLKVGGLHKDYGVSRRAIQRDFKAISKRHHIIDYPFGRGVKQFEEGFGLVKPNLSTEQEAALLMSNEVSKNLGSLLYKPFEKVYKDLVGAKPGNKDFHVKPVMPKRKDSHTVTDLRLQAIENAIQKRWKLKISYAPPRKKGRISRCVCPIELLVAEGYTYVLAMPEGRANALNMYRLDRIKRCDFPGMPKQVARKWNATLWEHPTYNPEQFDRPKNIERLLKKCRSIWSITSGKSPKISVKLVINKWAVEYFRNNEIVGGQKIKRQKDGSLIFEAKVNHLMEVIPYILRWMPDITVIEPQELKAEITDRIEKYLNK